MVRGIIWYLVYMAMAMAMAMAMVFQINGMVRGNKAFAGGGMLDGMLDGCLTDA